MCLRRRPRPGRLWCLGSRSRRRSPCSIGQKRDAPGVDRLAVRVGIFLEDNGVGVSTRELLGQGWVSPRVGQDGRGVGRVAAFDRTFDREPGRSLHQEAAPSAPPVPLSWPSRRPRRVHPSAAARPRLWTGRFRPRVGQNHPRSARPQCARRDRTLRSFVLQYSQA